MWRHRNTSLADTIPAFPAQARDSRAGRRERCRGDIRPSHQALRLPTTRYGAAIASAHADESPPAKHEARVHGLHARSSTSSRNEPRANARSWVPRDVRQDSREISNGARIRNGWKHNVSTTRGESRNAGLVFFQAAIHRRVPRGGAADCSTHNMGKGELTRPLAIDRVVQLYVSSSSYFVGGYHTRSSPSRRR